MSYRLVSEHGVKFSCCLAGDESNFAWQRLFDRREGCTVAGGVTESGIAGIAVVLRAALDRAATMTRVWSTWRFAQDKFKVAEYSPRSC
jgi:hypothetical protein